MVFILLDVLLLKRESFRPAASPASLPVWLEWFYLIDHRLTGRWLPGLRAHLLPFFRPVLF